MDNLNNEFTEDIKPNFFYNHSHYHEVRKKRKELGLSVASLMEELPNHPLVGKKIHNIETNKIYTVERVYKEFIFGWFCQAIIECNGSHGQKIIENINSGEEYIQKCADDFHKNFVVL